MLLHWTVYRYTCKTYNNELPNAGSDWQLAFKMSYDRWLWYQGLAGPVELDGGGGGGSEFSTSCTLYSRFPPNLVLRAHDHLTTLVLNKRIVGSGPPLCAFSSEKLQNHFFLFLLVPATLRIPLPALSYPASHRRPPPYSWVTAPLLLSTYPPNPEIRGLVIKLLQYL